MPAATYVVQPFTANGGVTGIVQVASTTDFVADAFVVVISQDLGPLLVKVATIDSGVQLTLANTDDSPVNLSTFLLADGARVTQYNQADTPLVGNTYVLRSGDTMTGPLSTPEYVKVGASAFTASVAGAGAIRYFGGDLQVSNGTIWEVVGGGGGDVIGPASVTDNALVRFDGTTGKLIQQHQISTLQVSTLNDNGLIALRGDNTSASPGLLAVQYSTAGASRLSLSSVDNFFDYLCYGSTSTVVSDVTGLPLAGRVQLRSTGAGANGLDMVVNGAVGFTARHFYAAENRLQLSAGETVINETGLNIDFRVEGDTNAHLIFADASVDQVGINAATPNEKLTVGGNLSLAEQVSPPAGTAGFGKFFVKASDSLPYFLDEAGVEWSLSGTGDVVGPASATDNAIARFDTTTGKLLQNSSVTIDDLGIVDSAGTLPAFSATQSDAASQCGFFGSVASGVFFSGLVSGASYVGAGNLYASATGSIEFAATGASLTKFGIGTLNAVPLDFFQGQQARFSVTGNGTSGEMVINDSGGDYDFRVEGDTNPNLLFAQASTDRIGIGTNTPNEKLTVNGNLSLAEQGSAPTATAGFGKFFVKSSDSLPYFLDDSGNERSFVAGTGVANRVAYWGSSTTLTSDADLYYDSTIDMLSVGSASVVAPIAGWSGVQLGKGGLTAGVLQGSGYGISVLASSNIGASAYGSYTTSSYPNTASPGPKGVDYVIGESSSGTWPSGFYLVSGSDIPTFSPRFAVIGHNGHVGIGTATPGHKLHIVGGSLPTTVRSLFVEGTLATVTNERGVNFNITGNGAGTNNNVGVEARLLAGYTGSRTSIANSSSNLSASTGTDILFNQFGNFSQHGYTQGVASGTNIGTWGYAQGSSSLNVGLGGRATHASAPVVGTLGSVWSGFGHAMGGHFSIVPGDGSVTVPTVNTSAALVADNSTTTAPIFLGRDNSVTVFTIADGSGINTFGASEVVFNDGGANIDFRAEGDTNPNLVVVDASADRVGFGTNTPAHFVEIVAGSLSSSFRGLNVTGDLSSAGSVGFFTNNRTGSDAGSSAALRGTTSGTYTGAGPTYGIIGSTSTPGTGTGIFSGNFDFNIGTVGAAAGATVGTNAGLYGVGTGGSALNYGIVGHAQSVISGARNVGIIGNAHDSGVSASATGGAFGLWGATVTAPTTFPQTALYASNATTTSPIFIAQDNTTTVFTIADGGNVTSTATVTAAQFTNTGSLWTTAQTGTHSRSFDFSNTGTAITATGQVYWMRAAVSPGGAAGKILSLGTSGTEFYGVLPNAASADANHQFVGKISVNQGAGIVFGLGLGTGNGNAAFTSRAASSGVFNAFLVQPGAHTNQTASTETIDVDFDLNRTVQHATGAITNLRAFVVRPPTHSAVGASVVTNAATLAIEGPPAEGANVTITNTRALWVQAGESNFGGVVQLAGGIRHSQIIVNSATTLNASHDTILCDTGTYDVDLPLAASVPGQRYTFHVIGGVTTTATVRRAGSDLIFGATSFQITDSGSFFSVTIQSTGVASVGYSWIILGTRG